MAAERTQVEHQGEAAEIGHRVTYSHGWESARRDSNPRPSAWKADTLTAELLALMFVRWSRWRESNPRPAAYKAAALATELHRQKQKLRETFVHRSDHPFALGPSKQVILGGHHVLRSSFLLCCGAGAWRFKPQLFATVNPKPQNVSDLPVRHSRIRVIWHLGEFSLRK